MVNLTRIYTRTGDDGTTGLGDFSRTSKTDPRLVAYADVAEANAALGVTLATGGLDVDIVAVLRRVQNELFDVGADLCTPLVDDPPTPPLRVRQPWIADLEHDCDRFLGRLTPLRSFILPGGCPASAHLHLATTVVRRAERSTWAAIGCYGTAPASTAAPGGVNPLTATYLNRLSDLLFVLARCAARDAGGDVLWQPGGGREPAPERQGDRSPSRGDRTPTAPTGQTPSE